MEVFSIKAFRAKNKITQKELAALLDCTQSFVSAVEKGLRPFPKEMLVILQSKYGDISDCMTEENNLNNQAQSSKRVSLTDESLDFITAGGEAFSLHIVKMMNDRLIAPYGLLVEKDKEIEKLNRQIGRLEAQLELVKKDVAPVADNATVADVG